MMLFGSELVPSLVWLAVATYLVVAGLVVLGTDFQAPRDNPGAQFVVCLVALVFAAAWPFRAMRRMLQRSA
jgi:hypothetical protein